MYILIPLLLVIVSVLLPSLSVALTTALRHSFIGTLSMVMLERVPLTLTLRVAAFDVLEYLMAIS